MIYLDSAATTYQKPPAVFRAVRGAMASMTSPGRGTYGPAARASRTLLACREEAAALFQVGQPERVVLTFNATHGLNIAVHSLVKPGATVLLSGYEHNAVTRPLASIADVRLRVVRAPLFCPNLFLEELERRLTPEVDVVICTHVSNVFGYVLPVEEVAALCRRRQVPLLLWTPPSRPGCFLCVWRTGARPLWRCLVTRGSMVPREPGCSSAKLEENP